MSLIGCLLSVSTFFWMRVPEEKSHQILVVPVLLGDGLHV